MTDAEFDLFLAKCNSELQQKQADLEAQFGLGKWASWGYDQLTGLLTFRDVDGSKRVEAATTFIGSFSERSETWIWGWANGSLLIPQREKSERLKSLADLTGIETFRKEGGLRVDEVHAWEVVAMSVHLLGSLGCYRGPSERSSVFLSIDSIWRL